MFAEGDPRGPWTIASSLTNGWGSSKVRHIYVPILQFCETDYDSFETLLSEIYADLKWYQNLCRYIKANIAIHTDDPWFWQKLRSAILILFQMNKSINTQLLLLTLPGTLCPESGYGRKFEAQAATQQAPLPASLMCHRYQRRDYSKRTLWYKRWKKSWGLDCSP